MDSVLSWDSTGKTWNRVNHKCANRIYYMLWTDNGDDLKVRMSGRVRTIAEADRDRSKECQKLKKAPHPGAGKTGERCFSESCQRAVKRGRKTRGEDREGKWLRLWNRGQTGKNHTLWVANFLNLFPVVLCIWRPGLLYNELSCIHTSVHWTGEQTQAKAIYIHKHIYGCIDINV